MCTRNVIETVKNYVQFLIDSVSSFNTMDVYKVINLEHPMFTFKDVNITIITLHHEGFFPKTWGVFHEEIDGNNSRRYVNVIGEKHYSYSDSKENLDRVHAELIRDLAGTYGCSAAEIKRRMIESIATVCFR